MTDKQIIIAKELVNSLSQRIKNLGENCIEQQKKNNKLKAQLKVKEQECERLKEENAEIRKYQYEQDFLQQQLNQLKEQLEAYKMEAEEGKEINAELKAENEHLAEKEKEVRHYLKEAYKYRKTLTEIKEICNNNDELQGNFNLVDCDKYKLGKHNLAQKIIAKINEVEDEKNM